MRINLGAGNFIEKGFINHDLTKHRPEIDIYFDLNSKSWLNEILHFDLYDKVEFDEIKAFDVIEHLDDPINFMNNCWDLLKPDGMLYLKACGWQNPNFWVDITHKRAFDIKSFDYFDPETELGRAYGFYTNKRWRIISKNFDRRMNVIIKMKPIK